jgi:4'-phosphopantetheinyl transferase EntD
MRHEVVDCRTDTYTLQVLFAQLSRRARRASLFKPTWMQRPVEFSTAGYREELADRLRRICDADDVGLASGCRAIATGDEHALRPSELFVVRHAIPSVRRASGAARILARQLVIQLGGTDVDLPRVPGHGPQWPAGFIGSMAHDQFFAVAVVSRSGTLRSVGIDIEPAESLMTSLVDIVATPRERAHLRGDLLAARLLFCIKEAVYKATHPLDAVFLSHHDIEYYPAASIARTRTGHELHIRVADSPRLLAVALLF